MKWIDQLTGSTQQQPIEKNVTVLTNYHVRVTRHLPPCKAEGRTRWTKLEFFIDILHDGHATHKLFANGAEISEE